MRDAQRLIWSGIQGRNGADSPIALDDQEAVEVLNMDFAAGALGRKRHGAVADTLPITTGQMHGLLRHVPAQTTETGAELWAFAVAAATSQLLAYRRPPSTGIWTTPPQVGTPTVTERHDVSGATLNGKLFLAYKGTQNRLRVWDGDDIRYVGLIVPHLPPVRDTGTGTYPATDRYYRVAWAEIVGGVVEGAHIVNGDHVRRSELSPAAGWTPAGTGASVTLTRPAPAGEGETHWLVYASVDQVYSNYHHIATVPIATSEYVDSAAPASYAGDAPAIAGLHMPPPGAKFLLTDGNRLLMAGAHETTAQPGETQPKNNRVWYTRVLGSSDIGDDESIPNTSASGTTPAQKNWTDIGENDGGVITGMGIVEGVVFVFKRRQTWRLVPTGDDVQPYQAFLVSNEIGAMNHKGIVAGEDAAGTPALYFYTYRGLYRLSLAGALSYLGRPIEDIWQTNPAEQPNAFGVYFAERRQVWHFIEAPTLDAHRIAVFDVDRGGWSLFTTAGLHFQCAVMYSATVTAGVASNNLTPYFAANSALLKYDIASAADDAGATFQAYVKSRPYFPAGIGTRVLTHDAVLLAQASSGVTLSVTVDRDFGRETRTARVSLSPEANETRILRRVMDSGFGACGVVQFQIGDAAPVANYWVLEALSVPIEAQESLS